MTFQAPGAASRRRHGQTSRTDRLRARLVHGIRAWNAQLAHDTAMLDLLIAVPSEDPTCVARGITALHMYGAVEAIEEHEDALMRLEQGVYGNCQSCGRPIPIEWLELIPHTRFCACCPPAAYTAPRLRRPRVRVDEGDQCLCGGSLSVAKAALDPRVLAASEARHPSAVRYEHPRDDTAPS